MKTPTFEDVFGEIKQMIASMDGEKARTFAHGLRTGVDAAVFRADDLQLKLAEDTKVRTFQQIDYFFFQGGTNGSLYLYAILVS